MGRLSRLLSGCLGVEAGQAGAAERPPPPERRRRVLPPPPLAPLASPPPPSPSKLPLAPGSLAAVHAPRSLDEALDRLRAEQQPGSPPAAPGPSMQTVAAFSAGQRPGRRQVTPEQRRRERRRLAEEQADHRRTVEALERGMGLPLRRPRSPDPPHAQCPGAPAAPPPPAAFRAVFQQASEAAACQLVPLHARRDATLCPPAVAPPAAPAVPQRPPAPASSAGSAAGSTALPSAAGGAASSAAAHAVTVALSLAAGSSRGSGVVDATSFFALAGSCCSQEAQAAGSSPSGSVCLDSLAEAEAALHPGAALGADARCTAGAAPAAVSAARSRSPAQSDEVPACETPSFLTVMGRAGREGSAASTAASRPLPGPGGAAAAGGTAPGGGSPPAHQRASPSASPQPASSTAGLLPAGEKSSHAAEGPLIPAMLPARDGPRAAPLLAQIRQALTSRGAARQQRQEQQQQQRKAGQRAPAAAGAEDVQPKLAVRPKPLARTTTRTRGAGGGSLPATRSADENSPFTLLPWRPA